MAQVSDYMDSPWWRSMYFRNLVVDPTNKHYGLFSQPGLTMPLTVDSTNEYNTAMNRHNDGLNAYSVGAVSQQVAARMGNPHPASPMLLGVSAPSKVGASPRPTYGISGCAAKTGDPSGCVSAYLRQPLNDNNTAAVHGSRYSTHW